MREQGSRVNQAYLYTNVTSQALLFFFCACNVCRNVSREGKEEVDSSTFVDTASCIELYWHPSSSLIKSQTHRASLCLLQHFTFHLTKRQHSLHPQSRAMNAKPQHSVTGGSSHIDHDLPLCCQPSHSNRKVPCPLPRSSCLEKWSRTHFPTQTLFGFVGRCLKAQHLLQRKLCPSLRSPQSLDKRRRLLPQYDLSTHISTALWPRVAARVCPARCPSRSETNVCAGFFFFSFALL